MRKIEFRGQDNTGDWVTGNLEVQYDSNSGEETYYITISYCKNSVSKISKIEVNKDTVGQYTGLCDSAGFPIYEHDIIQVIYFNKKGKKIKMRAVVGYSEKHAIFLFVNFTGKEPTAYAPLGDLFGNNHLVEIKNIEIIGNFFNHPELITEYKNEEEFIQ